MRLPSPRLPYGALLRGPGAILGLSKESKVEGRIPKRSTGSMIADPPLDLPDGKLLRVPGRGEFFLRDTGGSGPAVLLIHGWMFPSDLNWFRVYEPLAQAGYRVLAVDCRGHGRGPRPVSSFRLEDCADDMAAVVSALDCAPAVVVGYSMGGAIAQLMARDHPDVVSALVLAATSREWSDLRMKLLWNGMGMLRLYLELFPRHAWRWALRSGGFPDSPTTSWVASELSRGSALDIAEAGRELGRYDSRAWIESLAMPAAVIVTTKDNAVPPEKQYLLAAALKAPTFEIACDHGGVLIKAARYADVVLEALGAVTERETATAASA